jgi:hypothetical protein
MPKIASHELYGVLGSRLAKDDLSEKNFEIFFFSKFFGCVQIFFLARMRLFGGVFWRGGCLKLRLYHRKNSFKPLKNYQLRPTTH